MSEEKAPRPLLGLIFMTFGLFTGLFLAAIWWALYTDERDLSGGFIVISLTLLVLIGLNVLLFFKGLKLRRRGGAQKVKEVKQSVTIADQMPISTMPAILTGIMASQIFSADQSPVRDLFILGELALIVGIIAYDLWKEIKRVWPLNKKRSNGLYLSFSLLISLVITPLLPALMGFQFYKTYQCLIEREGYGEAVSKVKGNYFMAVIIITISTGLYMYHFVGKVYEF